MNAALAGSDARALIALNPDTAPPPRSLAALVAVLDREPEVGLVGPRLDNEDGTPQHSAYRFPSIPLAAVVNLAPPTFLRRTGVGQRWWLEGNAPPPGAEPDWLIGAVHCIRTAALDDELPYSERWFMYVEDVDLCWRLRSRGWHVRLARDVVVPHVGNASGAQAWGEARTERWWKATYDWFALQRGVGRARVYAGLNLVGATARAAGAATMLSTIRRGDSRRQWARRFYAVSAGVHLRAIVQPRMTAAEAASRTGIRP